MTCAPQVGVFEMTDGGLAAVANPSALFLRDRDLAPNVSSAVTVAMEGTRPLLLEVQALCSPVHQARGPRKLVGMALDKRTRCVGKLMTAID